MRYYNDIIVHCSATREGKNIKAADIRRWHLHEGYTDIGYHYVIDLDGTIEPGRPLDEIGAHCKGHNKDSIGICYVGGINKAGFNADTRTPAQKRALARLIWRLTTQALNAGFGLPAVHGHHDYCPYKDCPCFDAHKEYN